MLTYQQQHIALGSQTEVVLVSNASSDTVQEYFRQLWLAIFTFERSFSRFLPASELSQFNRAAGTKQPVSPEFQALLSAALRMAAESGGLYNPFILPALQRAGYAQSMVAAHRHDPVDDFSDRAVVAPNQLEVGETWARIPYGTAIDLGGCGKGYLGDRLADLADRLPELQGYWFSLGGDIVVGGHDERGEPWVIGIERTTSSTHLPLAGWTTASVHGHYAVATSSVTARKGVKQGQAWHHIIDPRTNQPAVVRYVTTTVCAASGLVADVLASCLLLLSSRSGQQLARTQNADGLLWQAVDGRITSWGNVQKEVGSALTNKHKHVS